MRKPTIYEKLWEKLGRRHTDAEACEEVKRILREASADQLVAKAGQGKLPWHVSCSVS